MSATQMTQEQPTIAAELWHLGSHWDGRETWVDGCDHESLKARPDFQDWLTHVSQEIATRVGETPRLRMYSYEHGAKTMVALDIFGELDSNCMAITVQVSPGMALLTTPVGGQLDLVLPCLTSVESLGEHLTNQRLGDSFLSRQSELLP
jgi:hypothetical protein